VGILPEDPAGNSVECEHIVGLIKLPERDRWLFALLAASVILMPISFAVHAAVEDVGQFVHPGDVGAVVADPPRTGMSPEALTAVVALRAAQIVYVSCDPPTLARDAAKLMAAGYGLTSLRGFDLFPNTAHVESVAVFAK